MGNESVARRSTELLAFNGYYAVPHDNRQETRVAPPSKVMLKL
jgi:hypothetical protein